MTTLEQIHSQLAQLDEQQLQQVAQFILRLHPPSPRQKRLSDFYGALPATRPYPGKAAIRQQITAYLAHKHHLSQS